MKLPETGLKRVQYFEDLKLQSKGRFTNYSKVALKSLQDVVERSKSISLKLLIVILIKKKFLSYI